jgi:hypothetical protein
MQPIRILMIEDLFGYGPFGVLSALVTAITNQAARAQLPLHITYAGTGPPLDLAKRHTKIAATYDIDTLDSDISLQLRRIMKEQDLIISVMNRPAILAASAAGLRSIFVDTLYHQRHALDPIDEIAIPSTVPHFVSHFPGVYTDVQGTKLIVVNPIVSNNIQFAHPTLRSDGVLISFGGLSFNKESARHLTYDVLAKYVDVNITCIVRSLRRRLGNQARIVLAIPAHIEARLPAADGLILIDEAPVSTRSFAHEQMCALLSDPGLGYYFATSGMGNINEAMAAGITMYPSPSANPSQYLAAKTMAGILEFDEGWPPELVDLAGIDISAPTEEGRAWAMAKAVDVISGNQSLQHSLEEQIFRMLERVDRRELGILQHGIRRGMQAESQGKAGADEVAAFALQTVLGSHSDT